MNMPPDETTRKPYSVLFQLATGQNERSADEAAAARYWAPGRQTVLGHRTAATSLCADADRLATASRRS